MQIVSSRKIKPEKVLPIITKGGIGLSLLLIGCFVFFSSFPLHMQKKGNNLSISQGGISSKLLVFSLEMIGHGPLSLNPLKHQLALPDMSQEILVLAKNINPDSSIHSEDLLIGLKTSGFSQKVKSGELVFLNCDPQPGGISPFYRFSDLKTPLWIRPSFLDKNKVLIEVGLFLPSKDSESFLEEKTQFVVQIGSAPLSEAAKKSVWFETLCQAKLWGNDLFLTRYGGEKYRSFKDKWKLEIPKTRGSSFYFIKEGDSLVWNEGHWMDVSKVGAIANKPQVQVKKISPRDAELEVWSEEGFCSQTLKISLQSEHSSLIKPEVFPQSVRMKSSRQVSCCFGKRRYLLKEGDWILKTSRGWRILKRSVDIEDYFCHKLRGELYIFEALTREQGKLVMKGVWIDEMRIQTQLFSIPVLGDNQSKSLARKEKKSLLFKKTEASTEELRRLK